MSVSSSSSNTSISLNCNLPACEVKKYKINTAIRPWFEKIIEAGRNTIIRIDMSYRTFLKKKTDQKYHIALGNWLDNQKIRATNKFDRLLPRDLLGTGLILPTAANIKTFRQHSIELIGKINNIIEDFLSNCNAGNVYVGKDINKAFLYNQKAQLSKIFGNCHFESIHQHALWDSTQVIDHIMDFDRIKAKSSFRALGPGLSSQVSRVFTALTAVVPNFFFQNIALVEN